LDIASLQSVSKSVIYIFIALIGILILALGALMVWYKVKKTIDYLYIYLVASIILSLLFSLNII